MGGRWGHGVHVGGGGWGGACGLVGGCAREGDGGAVSSATERHRAADRAEERPGLAKVGRGARGARGVGGAAVSGGARTPLGGDESRRASSTGANPGGGWGERHAVPSRPNRTGTGPAGGIPGGRAGLGTGALGPGSLVVVGRRGGERAGPWAAAGEGGRGRAGRARGRTPRGPRGLGERSPRRPFLEGGGGVAPCPGDDGGPSGMLYGMVWYGMVWYGMVLYGMVWYGMLLLLLLLLRHPARAGGRNCQTRSPWAGRKGAVGRRYAGRAGADDDRGGGGGAGGGAP